MTQPTTGAEIRRAFLDFFRERDHTIVPSASLIPHDPSLLLTVAGMVPFKPYLLGEEPPPYLRATTSQKVIRTVDIDVVGTTARHMSFFEMLGNFSFGDYFKERAIPWAYEFATEVLGFDPERLWFTVHDSDDEAAEIWIDQVGVPAGRVQRRDRENFWQMGVPGPAGPCSELFYDRGPDFGEEGGPVVDEERFMEFWNLVFMQYVQDEPYRVVGDLPAKSIDTGAGLERVCVLRQGVANAFETDLVRPVLEAGERATGVAYGTDARADVSLRILADHGRAVSFLIADGVVPSNEGRGYVLRRLLRRAVRHAWQLGAADPVVPGLVAATVSTLGDAYPALATAADGIAETAEREEVRFRRTLESGHSLLSDELAFLQEGSVLPGATAFRLHDTFGFPVELTEEIAAERGVAVDVDGFEEAMAEQRERARGARARSVHDDAPKVYRSILDGSGPTDFRGYEHLDTEGSILAIVADGEPVERADEGRDVEVFVDATTFYGESGGQVGDTGRVSTPTGELRIADTQLRLPGLHGHVAKVVRGHVAVGQPATLTVDAGRRERIRKSHTGTHILHWALREVVGPHAHQAGSLVEPNRLRFDFSHYAKVDDDELIEVERVANERVIENASVQARVTTREEADRIGAIAFFGEKYGDEVRVVDVGSYSRELCGGTHVATTGQVGPLIVVSESSIGANLRRVQALTGSSGYEYLAELRRRLDDTASALRVAPDRTAEAARRLMERSRELEDRIEAMEARSRSALAEDIVAAADVVGEHRLVVTAADGLGPEALRLLALQIRDRMGSGVAVVGAARDGKGSLVTVVSADLVPTGISAAVIAAAGAAVLGGGASRDPELAQAGGPAGDRLGDALDAARRTALEALGTG
jgi:alanyl-tRNA synthetase